MITYRGRLMKPTGKDLFWLAANAYHEARGETDEGVKAVCHVVLNRAGKRGQSVKEVVLAPYQFSWANGNSRPPFKNYEAFERCFSLATEACEEHGSGTNLSGADHYHALHVHPGWAKSMKIVATIGRHIFYRS